MLAYLENAHDLCERIFFASVLFLDKNIALHRNPVSSGWTWLGCAS